MQLSDNGLRLIKGFEAYMRALPDGNCVAYRCMVGRDKNGHPIYDGKQTIGWGCTEGVKEGDVWTPEQAEAALRKEIAKHEAAVSQLVTQPTNANEFDSFCSLSYNIGTGIGAKKDGFANSSILSLFNKGDKVGAARAFALYNKSQGIVVPGLVARRAREQALFLKPVEPSPEPAMPQTVDPPPEAPAGSRKVLVANAGAVSAVSTGAGIAAINVADTFQYGTQALNLVKEHGTSAVLIGLFAVAAAFATIKHFTRQDHEEGRYIPSGESK